MGVGGLGRTGLECRVWSSRFGEWRKEKKVETGWNGKRKWKQLYVSDLPSPNVT